ncbi:hypothetical protein BHM03_00040021, partial [Ensete ventricosum]
FLSLGIIAAILGIYAVIPYSLPLPSAIATTIYTAIIVIVVIVVFHILLYHRCHLTLDCSHLHVAIVVVSSLPSPAVATSSPFFLPCHYCCPTAIFLPSSSVPIAYRRYILYHYHATASPSPTIALAVAAPAVAPHCQLLPPLALLPSPASLHPSPFADVCHSSPPPLSLPSFLSASRARREHRRNPRPLTVGCYRSPVAVIPCSCLASAAESHRTPFATLIYRRL